MDFCLVLFYYWLPWLAACISDGGDSGLFLAWLLTDLIQELLRCDTCDLWVPSLWPAMDVGLLNCGCSICSQKMEIELVSKLFYVQWVEITLVNSYGEAESNGWSKGPRQILSNRFVVKTVKTDLRSRVHSVWALFNLSYLSFVTNVLITEVSALPVSMVWPPPVHAACFFSCASPTCLLVAAGCYFSFCSWAAEPARARTESLAQLSFSAN